MPEDFADLVRRIDDLEARLRGESGEPIDLRSLPLNRLQNHLEAEWLPSAPRLIEPKSITAAEVGVLPGARVWLNGNYPIPNLATTPLEFNNIVYDSDNMVAFNTTPAYAWPYGAYFQARTPGIYLAVMGAAWNPTFTAAQVGWGMQWSPTPTGAWTTIATHDEGSVAGAVYGDTVAWLGALSADARIRCYAFQNSGAGQFVDSYAVANRLTFFAAQWLGSLSAFRTEQP